MNNFVEEESPVKYQEEIETGMEEKYFTRKGKT